MKVRKTIVDSRREEIMKLLQGNNYIKVEDLAKRFNVSTVTIRRDLQFWEDRGAIIRDYGGASLIQAFVEDPEYENKRFVQAIAKRASQFIENDDIIFINSSRTALAIIQYIKNKHVVVITNNANVIGTSPDPLVNIVLTGGDVRFPKKSLTGDTALATLNNITATKCFIGCSGLTEEGISTSYIKEMMINQTMLKNTGKKRFVLCDHTKFGLKFAFQYSTFDSIDYLITDHLANQEIIDKIKYKKNIEIIKEKPMNVVNY